MKETTVSNDIYCLPHEDNYIVYLPLRGLIILGNDEFVNLLCQARQGDRGALKKLDISETFTKELFDSEKQLKQLTGPRKPPPFAPTSVSLFLTNDCTLRCNYCYARGITNKNQMPWDMVTGVLDEILENVLSANSKRMGIHFHGGGDISAAWPLLVRTREYVHAITAPHNIKTVTSIGLNGVLNSQQQQWIVDHIDSATVSIDGPPDIHNSHRPFPNGKPSFAFVDRTLKAFDRANYPYAIRTTVTAESVKQLAEIVQFFCHHYQTRKIKLEPMYLREHAETLTFHPPDASDFVKYFRKARVISKEAGRKLLYSGARLGTITNVFCQAAGNSCAITPDGWVTSCYEVLSPSDPLSDTFIYGHYNRRLKKLEIDERRRKDLFQFNVLNKPFCAKCFCKWHCAGDCPVKSLHAENAPDQDFPDRCYINRELTKDQLVEALSSRRLERNELDCG
jgi:uncharacterized protein